MENSWGAEMSGALDTLQKRYKSIFGQSRVSQDKEETLLKFQEKDLNFNLAASNMVATADAIFRLSDEMKLKLITRNGQATHVKLEKKQKEAGKYAKEIQEATQEIANRVQISIERLQDLQARSQFRYLVAEEDALDS
eukprot:TRINITY_DN16168_c0_g1_i1.p1 TRINITY_DN16168_c0_g1~~TRINITY_DN16168_c0_g1_i1.p1  ORF type:complete len:138 (-),score=45.87 TRINITY_DN16168_c0_g1_i1:47-460(-)